MCIDGIICNGNFISGPYWNGKLRHLEKQTGSKRGRETPPAKRIHQLPLITGTVELVDITEQSLGLPLQENLQIGCKC